MRDNLEDLFKNKFEHYKQQPRASSWEKINKKITRKIIIKKVLYSALIAVIVTGLVSAVYFYEAEQSDIKKTENINIVSNPEVELAEVDSNELVMPRDTSEHVRNEFNQRKTGNNKNKSNVNSNISEQKKSELSQIKVDENINTKIETVEFNNGEVGFSISQKQGCCPFVLSLANIQTQSMATKWTIGEEIFKDIEKIDIALNSPGTYPIELQRTEKGNLSSYRDTVVVLDKPKADFNIPTEIFERKLVEFENISRDATSFYWLIDGLLVSNEKELEYTFDIAGSHTISLIVMNEYDCSDTSTQDVTVAKGKEFLIFPTAFSPNIYGPNGGYYSKFIKNNEVFYPVTNLELNEYNLMIFNSNGSKIFESNDITIGWDGYYRDVLVDVGVYVYVVKYMLSDGKIYTKRGSLTVIYDK